MTDVDFFTEKGAQFSACRRYRYALWRRWANGPAMLWIMLNPSTADEDQNDPTVERCQRRAYESGYGAVWVANLFALRSTDPAALYAADDPIGRMNDDYIGLLASNAGLIVCGWGNHGRHLGRGREVLDALESAKLEPHALRCTAAGHPGHPLYISYDIQPRPFLELLAAA